MSTFLNDDRVHIHNLNRAKANNNLIGVVRGTNGDKLNERYKVFVVNLDKSILIKAVNLRHSNCFSEINSILRHLAKDEKCKMIARYDTLEQAENVMVEKFKNVMPEEEARAFFRLIMPTEQD